VRCLVLLLLAACSAPPLPPAAPRDDGGPTRVRIEYTHTSFQSSKASYEVVLRGGRYRAGGRPIPTRFIDDLAAALTDLRPADGIYECTSHTDDYRTYRVTVDGARPFELRSNSNCTLELPWHVVRDGAVYVQYTGAIGKAVHRLLHALDAKRFGAPIDVVGPPRGGVYIGSYGSGQGFAGRGEELPGIAAPLEPVAAKCGRGIETSDELRALAGQPLQITWMSVTCDLETSPTCEDLTATASFTWNNVSVSGLALSCRGGAFTPSPRDRITFAALRDFLASRPAQVLARSGAQLSFVDDMDGGWTLHGGGDQLALRFTTGKTKVAVFAFAGVASKRFLSDLGIDPARMHRPGTFGGGDTLQGDIDFDGRLLP
jgi:hypothetical protein